jgi:hypothetical protein
LVAGSHGPALIDLLAIDDRTNVSEDFQTKREGSQCIHFGDSSDFVASNPRNLIVASGQAETNKFREDLEKGNDKEEESGKVESSVITMAIVLEICDHCQLMFVPVLVLHHFHLKIQKSMNLLWKANTLL